MYPHSSSSIDHDTVHKYFHDALGNCPWGKSICLPWGKPAATEPTIANSCIEINILEETNNSWNKSLDSPDKCRPKQWRCPTGEEEGEELLLSLLLIPQHQQQPYQKSGQK